MLLLETYMMTLLGTYILLGPSLIDSHDVAGGDVAIGTYIVDSQTHIVADGDSHLSSCNHMVLVIVSHIALCRNLLQASASTYCIFLGLTLHLRRRTLHRPSITY